MIESKLIQVNKKKIAYIFVVLENVVYLQCDQARPQVDMMALYSPTVGGDTIFVAVKRSRCGLLS